MDRERGGDFETLVGALVGAVVLVIVLPPIGVVVGTSTGDPSGEGFAAGLALAITFGLLGFWFGPVVGAFLALRWRGFHDPERTARTMAITMPVIGLPILVATTIMSQMQNVALLILGPILAVSAAAIAARAFVRRRETAHF